MDPRQTQRNSTGPPRTIIAALRGGSGKTIVSIGIIAALRRLGHHVAPFKKGPDYIDAGWLAMAAGRPCFNLDTFLVEQAIVLRSFASHTLTGDIAVIEGNRGLFDGIDITGSTSTAELAKMLDAPVIFCIDCTKSTRTMAAAIMGCNQFDPEIKIKGVILNRVAGGRHENILRQNIEHHCGIPVIGAIPKLTSKNFPERHMGLIPIYEHGRAKDSVAAAARIARRHVDLDQVVDIALKAGELQRVEDPDPVVENAAAQPNQSIRRPRPRIGIIRDSAFQFYYPENLEALESQGAELTFVSPLADDTLPPLDGLYIGGGFPERHAPSLAANVRFRRDLYNLAQEGFPVYAECGGLIYLAEELILEGKSYPMAGVLPVVLGLSKRPRGHGYTIVRVERENPFYPVGTTIRGHEFHYSHVLKWRGREKDLVFRMKRGTGFADGRDGVSHLNVLATYTHIHALGTPRWAGALVKRAAEFSR